MNKIDTSATFSAVKNGNRKVTRKVSLTTLVPHTRQFMKNFVELDQGSFMIHCLRLSKNGRRKMFCIFDDLPCDHADCESVRSMIRSLVETAVERAYLIQRHLKKKARSTGAKFEELLKDYGNLNFAGKIARLFQKACKIISRWKLSEPKDAKLLRRFTPQEILDGIVASLPPWAVIA